MKSFYLFLYIIGLVLCVVAVQRLAAQERVIVGPNIRLHVRCQLARAYKALGKFDVAKEILMNILADDPKFSLAQTMLDSLKKSR